MILFSAENVLVLSVSFKKVSICCQSSVSPFVAVLRRGPKSALPKGAGGGHGHRGGSPRPQAQGVLAIPAPPAPPEPGAWETGGSPVVAPW